MVETRESTRLVAEDYEQVVCPNCGQEFEEVIPVWLGETVNPNGEVENQNVLCEGCADSIFDYNEELEPMDWDDLQDVLYPFKASISWFYLLSIAVGCSVGIGAFTMLITGPIYGNGSLVQQTTVLLVTSVSLYWMFVRPARKSVANSS